RNHYSESIQQGSVVETQKAFFYISVPLGEIAMEDGSEVFAISEEAPIYKHLEGKKEGDSFNFNGDEIKIIKVF
ncbi:MAG TPA: transcription elongation factor, partial [Salinimicrobium sp.]|nr:transcription elongation factor [Salinimicrobium sp.]